MEKGNERQNMDAMTNCKLDNNNNKVTMKELSSLMNSIHPNNCIEPTAAIKQSVETVNNWLDELTNDISNIKPPESLSSIGCQVVDQTGQTDPVIAGQTCTFNKCGLLLGTNGNIE